MVNDTPALELPTGASEEKTATAYGGWWGRIRRADGSLSEAVFRDFPEEEYTPESRQRRADYLSQLRDKWKQAAKSRTIKAKYACRYCGVALSIAGRRRCGGHMNSNLAQRHHARVAQHLRDDHPEKVAGIHKFTRRGGFCLKDHVTPIGD